MKSFVYIYIIEMKEDVTCPIPPIISSKRITIHK